MSTVDNARAIQAALQPLMGTPATGQVTVHSTGATGTVPFGSTAIPVVTGDLREEATAFVPKNPASGDGSWPVVLAGTAVPIESLHGGPVGNVAAGVAYRWDPPLPGIEATSVSVGAVAGGVASTAFAALKQIRVYKSLTQANFEQFLRAQLSQYPGAILAWESTTPLDGPMAATPSPRQARVGRGKFLFRHTWLLWLVTSRLDTEAMRRREGDALRDDIIEILFDCMQARGLRVSNEPGAEILSASPFAATPTSYVDLIRFGCTVTVQHRSAAQFNDWLRTRLRQQTDPQAPSSPPINLPDLTIPMT